jgi:galactofuranose transport system permease protein
MNRIASLVSNNRRFLPLFATGLLAMVAYVVGAGFYDGMRDPQVFVNLFRTSPFLLISAIGMTFVILTGGIDLSVSGVIALTTTAAAALLRAGWNPWLVILAMLVMGMALGAVMGSFIAYLKVQPFIATLAGMWIARGLCFFISDDAIAINDRIFRILGQTKILIPGFSDPVTKQGLFISILMVVGAVVLVAAIYIAHYTPFGRSVYAIGGNEASARLMGLPVNRTKVLVYTLNGFCSALAGIVMAIYVMSGHGLYANGFELVVIASVVMGGTMLTGGVGYVFGTQIGVLITGVTQTLIQFNGQLSSWWTNIVVGALTLLFIGAQSFFLVNRRRAKAGAEDTRPKGWTRYWRWYAVGLVIVGVSVLLIALGGRGAPAPAGGEGTETSGVSRVCPLKPFREDLAAQMLRSGAVIVYERSGGPACLLELVAAFPDGKVIGDNETKEVTEQKDPAAIATLLDGIRGRGWFTDEMYDTWHNPCGQCFAYHITVSHQGETKTVQGVDGGTDAPADYWQVVSLINSVVPDFAAKP